VGRAHKLASRAAHPEKVPPPGQARLTSGLHFSYRRHNLAFGCG
jgi:hypothetical protein